MSLFYSGDCCFLSSSVVQEAAGETSFSYSKLTSRLLKQKESYS